jgi:hypothetical protein
MLLYHASGHIYKSGDGIIGSTRTNLSAAQLRAEQQLAGFAPPHSQSRLSARFASDSAALSARYWESEAKGCAEKHLYRVCAEQTSWHPMALVDVAANSTDAATLAVVAKEYWTPTRTWRCLEYLAQELEVIEEIDWPNTLEMSGALFSFGEDRAEALRLRP